jgi:predicted nucleotidyltransferase
LAEDRAAAGLFNRAKTWWHQESGKSRVPPLEGFEAAMDMRDEWILDLGDWASQNSNVCELWLFGSRADGRSKPGSDVDIGVGLMPPTDDHNWAFANFIAFSSEWRRELEVIVGRHVSLEPITPEQPGTAVVPNWVLLWKRQDGQD